MKADTNSRLAVSSIKKDTNFGQSRNTRHDTCSRTIYNIQHTTLGSYKTCMCFIINWWNEIV